MRKLTMLLLLSVASIVRGQVVDNTLHQSPPLCGDDVRLTQKSLKAIRERGLHLYSGAVFDQERFGSVAIRKTDLFIGSSLQGLGRVDLTLQPTLFRARVTGDNTQSNSQYRTNFNLLYRILDEEREPGIPEKRFGVHWSFVHLVIPFKHDIALTGLKEFENFNVGIQADTKFFTAGQGRTTFLASFRYSYQRFHRLNKNQNLFSFEMSMGF